MHSAPGIRNALLICTLVLGMGAAAPVSRAGERTATEELRTLIEAQAAELERLRARLEALERAGDEAPQPSPAAVAEAPPLTPPSTVRWRGAPEITSPDREFSAKLRGRVQSDAWVTSSRTDGVDYPTGTTLRGARLGIEGQLGSAFRYKLEADFGADNLTTKDAYLQYVGRPGWALTLGNQKPPFSLEHMTGLPRTTFMERALPNVFSLAESLGASVTTGGRQWTLSLGLFGETPGVELDGKEGHAIVARGTFAPVLDDERFVHLGLSGYRRHLSSDSDAGFRIRQRPEVRVFGTRLVDTSAHPASGATALALELASSSGPFAMQGELMRNRVDYRQQEDATFSGGYVQAGWFLTGEHRPYDAGKATLGRVRPRSAIDAGGWGAFELAARFSTLDLDDGPVRGGSEDNFTLGLNWYPTGFTRLAFNWVYFDTEGNMATMPFGSPAHRGHAFGARAQVDW
jgi:phosphate-selective porin OprO and OprP